jgi:hypothetical protein
MNNNKAPRSQWISALVGNWVGVFGLVWAMSSLFVAIFLITIDFLHGFNQPYMGILIFLIIPSFIWTGLIFAGVGLWLELRRRKKGAAAEAGVEARAEWRTRQLVVVVACALLFLMLSSFGSYRAFEVTESPEFCGALCHTVMKPEYTTYKISPHARVRCTECHIGSGASWFVRSKISGMYQVYSTLTNSYPRPIPVPVQDLRPAPETCEQCHWPAKFHGWMELRRQFFLPDQQNTPWNIRMLVYVGGATATHGPVGGIHWHMSVYNRMEYLADESRQTIPWVRVTNRDTGVVTLYESKDKPLTPQQKNLPVRVLDCVDCHNRPTHIFESPYRALDVSMWLGRIDPSIPSIKVKAAKALVQAAEAVSQATGLPLIAQALSKEYSDYQDQPKIEQAISETQRIFRENFFPEMKTNWKVRPDNIGHYNWPGCFRCHDDSHVDQTGRAISKGCNTCHIITAQGAQEPETVSLQGLKFHHPGGEVPSELLCSECHTGAP